MKQSRGAASVEYALLIVLIAGAIVVAVATLGSTVISLFKTVADLFPTP
jgi:Flp pilus assembly pilin Flp